MADKIKIELNHGGAAQLLKQDSVADLRRRTAAIAAAATANSHDGAIFGHEVVIGANRAVGRVWTENWEAMHGEAKHRALTRAIDAGR